MKKLTVGSCFSGIGGLELGLEWTGGFETKWQIENDEYASRVLAKHWPNVRRYGDIREVSFPERVDVICGGFPCQDISVANPNARGIEGERSGLWKELLRIICEVRPRLAVIENTPMLLRRGMGTVLRDLAGNGFDAEWRGFSSHQFGASHMRKRMFIIAYPAGIGRVVPEIYRRDVKSCPFESRSEGITSRLVPYRDSQRVWAFPDTGTFRIPDGISRGIYRDSEWEQRLKCVGNAVDPRVAQKIGEMILEAER